MVIRKRTCGRGNEFLNSLSVGYDQMKKFEQLTRRIGWTRTRNDSRPFVVRTSNPDNLRVTFDAYCKHLKPNQFVHEVRKYRFGWKKKKRIITAPQHNANPLKSSSNKSQVTLMAKTVINRAVKSSRNYIIRIISC